MRKILFGLMILSALILQISCGEKEPQEQDLKMEQPVSGKPHNVLVEEKIDASNYSYLKVKEGVSSYWIAVPQMNINSGEYVIYSKAMEMKNFKSESLNRSFESILFVDDAKKSGSDEQLKLPHQNIATGVVASINIKPLKDGFTIEQIYDKKNTLEYKVAKVRGKVVKVNENIMGTNWIHIQDGTGSKGTHDLLVTSNQMVKVGATIVAEGKVIKDKDFGSGYFYNVLLENSKITIE